MWPKLKYPTRNEILYYTIRCLMLVIHKYTEHISRVKSKCAYEKYFLIPNINH